MSSALDTYDSFDTYASAQVVTNGWSGGNILLTSGRRGGGAFQPGGANPIRILRTNYQTLLMGVAYFGTSFLSSGATLMGFSDAGTTQLDLRANDATGGLKLTRNGTLVGTATATGLLTGNIWHYLELRVTFGTGTAGTAELKLDGTSVILASGVNTSNTGNAFANQVTLIGFVSFDDLYVFGGNSGSVPAYVGDLAAKASLPTADGTHLDFTPNSGTAHWSRVSDATPDEDTSTNTTGVAGNIDTLTMATVAAGTIFGVQQRIRHRFDDAGPHTVAAVVRIVGTDYTGTAFSTNATYLTTAYLWELSPATGVAWTVSEINGAQFGYKLVT